MKVLSAIGRFFAKIGRWIKDTAWVQPLLIVGAIFGLIFAIKPTVNWVKSWFTSGDEALNYYKSKKLKWDNVDKGTSEVDNLFKYLADPDANKDLSSHFGKFSDSDQFFVCFYDEDCSTCKNNYEALTKFESLVAEKNKDLEGCEKLNGKVTIYSVDCSEKASDAEDTDPSYFYDYVIGDDNNSRPEYFENTFMRLYSASYKSPYIEKNSISLESKFHLGAGQLPGIDVPTIFMFEKNYDGDNFDGAGNIAISEVLFDFATGSNLDGARLLWDCWRHVNDFSNEK